MICHRCLHRAFTPRIHTSLTCAITTSAPGSSPSNPSVITAANTAPPFSTPLSPASNTLTGGTQPRPKPKASLPVSIAPAGSSLKGLNFLKGREDPIALPEEDYPEWLWRCLDAKTKGADQSAEKKGDEFSKSKKQRRAAAKQQRKLETRLIASGDSEALVPKIPLQQQTVDLPANEKGSVRGALEAVKDREALTKAMRGDRRAKIKERNFLKGIR